MKQLFKSTGLKLAALVVGIATASFAIPPSSAFAAPTGCSAWKSTARLGAAKCTGGTGQVRVKVVCWSGGINYTDYGPWVGVGTTSFQTCPGSTWMDVGYQAPCFQYALAEVGAFLAEERLNNTLIMKVLGTSVPLGKGQVLREFTNTKARVQLTVADDMRLGEERYAAAWSFTRQGRPVLRETCWCITHK